jgi:PKD repeat protein
MLKVSRVWLPVLALLYFSGYAHAQQWARMMDEGRHNFYEIQAMFEDEWNGRNVERGSGYKPYKRWEYFMEERVFPSGEFPPVGQRFTEYNQFMSRKPSRIETERSNGDWELIGPTSWQNAGGWNPGIGRVNFIAEEPGNQNTIYVGTPAGGLWRSEDAGGSWTPLTDQLPSMGVSGIAIDPSNTNVIYIATGDRDANDYNGIGVLKSTDYGQTWQNTGISWDISEGIKSNWLTMHPTDFNTLLLASNEGVFKTTNGGISWQQVQTANIREVAYHPTNPDIVYAVSNRFYRSTNGGDNFSAVNEGFPSPSEINRLSLAVTPASPDYVYVLAGNDETSGFRGLYRSTDAGETFMERSDSPNILGYSSEGNGNGGQSWYDLALAASNTNGSRIFTAGINVWRSTNGGSTFTPRSAWTYPNDIGYTHADVHFLKMIDNRLYCGSDGGIFISTNEGADWTDISEGISITQPYRFAVSQQDPYKILAGTQDNGTNLLIGSQFNHVLGGDGNGAAMSADDDDIIYAAYPYGSIEVSYDGGQDFQGITQDIEEAGIWVTPFVLDPSNQNVLYAGYQNIWKFTTGSGWEVISEFGSGSFRSIAVAPSNNDFVYGAKGPNFFSTINGGQDWETGTSLWTGNITDIAVHPTIPDKIWISVSGYTAGSKVFTSNDHGLTWENVSFNLPNIPANSLAYNDTEVNGIYVGTDAGVFYTDDNLANWVDYMDGLPKTVVKQMLIHEGIGKIRAGTYGRGIWESDLYTPSTEPPQAAFTSNVQVICAGDSIQFTDLSYNAAPGWDWTFEGGTTLSTAERDPVVYYFEPGIFEVSLSVANANGESEAIETQYVVVLGNGDTTPFYESYEDFDDLLSNLWIAVDENEDAVTWQLNDSIGFESNKCIWVNNMENISGQIDEIHSPSFDLSGAGAATLSFKVAYAQRNVLNDDRLRVYISNDCGMSWSLRAQLRGVTDLPTAPLTETAFVPEGADQWQEVVITNFSASYFAPNFRFKFQLINDNGNNIFIDDINLTMSPVGIDDLLINTLDVELFPNPARSHTQLVLNLQAANLVSYNIMDVQGKIIAEQSLGNLPAGEHRIQIKTSDFASGMYLLKVQSEDKQNTLKLFVD